MGQGTFVDVSRPAATQVTHRHALSAQMNSRAIWHAAQPCNPAPTSVCTLTVGERRAGPSRMGPHEGRTRSNLPAGARNSLVPQGLSRTRSGPQFPDGVGRRRSPAAQDFPSVTVSIRPHDSTPSLNFPQCRIDALAQLVAWLEMRPALRRHGKLVPNAREAKVVRHIFQRFVELGSSTTLVRELKLDGVTAKSWTTQDGIDREGRPIDKGMIYRLLHNRAYLGEIHHKGQWFQGEHPPIVDRALWDQVHAILATNRRVRGNATRAKVTHLLKGIVFGNDGRALSPFHTTKKNGRRYRYYVPQRETKEHAGASGLPRLPAAELESAVLDQLRSVLRSPDLLHDVIPAAIALDPTLDEAKVTVAMTRLDVIWDQLFPAEQTRIVRLLVERVIVSPNDLEVRLQANGIERLVRELQPSREKRAEEALA